MLFFYVALIWFLIVVGLLMRAIRQFLSYEVIHADHPADGDAPTLAVIVPARNEAKTIGRCLEGLLSQDYPRDRLSILVVNDKSTDETGTIVGRLAERDERLKLIEGEALQEGWMGKPHACWQGAQAARAEWLCFLDADTAAAPALLHTAVAAAQWRRLDMLSLEPYQELGSFWERLIIPCGFFLMAFFQNFRRVNDPRSPKAVANGQFILIRRDVYLTLGGHAAVRNQITEDTALARLVKRSGHRLAVLGAEGLIRTRMYTGLRSLWEGVTKNVIVMAGGIPTTLLVALVALVLGWSSLLVPLWAWLHWSSSPADAWRWGAVVLASLASLTMFATHLAGSRYFGIPVWYGLLFPLGYSTGAVIALDSVRKWLRGRVSWKGRVYAPASKNGQVPSG